MHLKVVEWALVRLHKGYSIPAALGVTKVGQQYVRPFKVVERVGRLAYSISSQDQPVRDTRADQVSPNHLTIQQQVRWQQQSLLPHLSRFDAVWTQH